MKLFKKEKIGSKRIIHFLGLKFEYSTAKKYTYTPVTERGTTTIPRPIKLIVSLTSFPARILS